MNEESSKVTIEEMVYLEKFEGEPLPENLFERVHIKNGEVVKIERFELAEKEVD